MTTKCVGCPFENGCTAEMARHCLKEEIPWRAGLDKLLDNPSTSFWLKDALRTSLERDPVDAWADSYVLEGILKARMDALLGKRIDGNKLD